MKPSEALLAAKARLMFDTKWVGHTPSSQDGEDCTTTALSFTVGQALPHRDQQTERDKLGGPATHYLREALPEGHRFIFAWNDQPERTFQEVLDLYDAAISLAKDAGE